MKKIASFLWKSTMVMLLLGASPFMATLLTMNYLMDDSNDKNI